MHISADHGASVVQTIKGLVKLRSSEALDNDSAETSLSDGVSPSIWYQDHFAVAHSDASLSEGVSTSIWHQGNFAVAHSDP